MAGPVVLLDVFLFRKVEIAEVADVLSESQVKQPDVSLSAAPVKIG